MRGLYETTDCAPTVSPKPLKEIGLQGASFGRGSSVVHPVTLPSVTRLYQDRCRNVWKLEPGLGLRGQNPLNSNIYREVQQHGSRLNLDLDGWSHNDPMIQGHTSLR